MPSLSIIIVNWNSKDYVRKCLASLERHCTVDRQVIVVDGASFDGCAEMIAREFPNVEFIQSQENLGFGRSNNLGLRHASGEYVLFLNPDTEVHPGALEALLDVASADPSVGLVGARLLNTDGSLQSSSVHVLPTPLNRTLDSNFLRRLFTHSSLWMNVSALPTDRPVEVEAVSGACMLLRHETCVGIGGFCPDYFMYAEDMHLCWEVAKLSKRIVYQPASTIIHHGGGASGGEFSKFSCIEMNRAIHKFIINRQGIRAGLAYRGLIGISASIRLVLLAVAWGFSGGHRRSRRSTSIRRWWTTLRWAAWRVDGMQLPAGTTGGTCVLS
jgi:N-acetylglucosaminyl-diphospho-decaprenol L-rhamnosyltransferase